MPTYEITDQKTGAKLQVTGDSPPTEAEMMQIFGSVRVPAKQSPKAIQANSGDEFNDVPEWVTKNSWGPNAYGVLGAAKEVARFGAETAGLVGGGMTGLAAGGPVGALFGAGLGYGAVKSGERWLEGKKTTPIGEAARTARNDVLTGMGMEAGGQVMGNAISRMSKAIRNPTSSGVSKEIVNERMALAKSQGIELTPAEATGSKGLALYESMLDKSPFSTSIINSMRELKQLKPLIALREKMLGSGAKAEQVEVVGQKIKDQVSKFLGQYKSADEAQLNKLRDNVLSKMGSSESFEALGTKAQEAIKNKSTEVYKKAGELYDKVGELVPEGVSVDPAKTREVAARLLSAEGKKPPSMQNPSITKILRDLSGADDALMQEVNMYSEPARSQILAKLKAEGDSGFDWKTIQSMRSELNSRIAQSDAAMKTSQPGSKFQSTPEASVYKQLRKALDEDITSFAEQSGGDIKDTFDLANAFYREGKLTYNSSTIRRLLKTNPEKVVDVVFRPNGGSELTAIRNAIGSDVFNTSIKPSVTKRLLGDGAFNPKALGESLVKYGDEVLGKVYSPSEIKSLKELATDGQMQLANTLPGSPFLKTIANERPEVVVDSILGSYDRFPGAKTVLRNVSMIRSVVDKETFASLQREMSDRIFKLNQLTDQVQPEKLSKTIQTYDRVLKLFYSPEQVQWLRDIAKTGKLMASAERQAGNPSGTAQNVITWGTWGALMRDPISGTMTGIIAPTQMAKLYLSDAGRRYFLNALKTPANSGKGAELMFKIVAITGPPIIRNAEDTSDEPTIE